MQHSTVQSCTNANCLKNKIVYIMGDSTTRQWFEYLERTVPGKGYSVFSLRLDSMNVYYILNKARYCHTDAPQRI